MDKSHKITATRQRRIEPDSTRTGIDVLETLKAELDWCVALLRPHYPEEDDAQLRDRAIDLRAECYARGRWPSDDEIVTRKAKAAEEGGGLHDSSLLSTAQCTHVRAGGLAICHHGRGLFHQNSLRRV
jgi:hypothetical protein